LVAEYTSQIPVAIIAEMMGVPRDETPYLQEVAGTISTLIGNISASWPDFRSATAVMREFDRFPELTLAGDPVFNGTIGLHGLTRLPVALRAAQSIRSTH
jgi:cytochrome P450